MDRKKELKEQYRQMKPQMGIFIIRSRTSKKYFIEGTQNLKGRVNSNRFKLDAGSHQNRELQKEWQDFGAENFTIEILENLEYDKNESKTDYREDLALLQMIWEEKLSQDGLELYQK
jgi:hypothetical protein